MVREIKAPDSDAPTPQDDERTEDAVEQLAQALNHRHFVALYYQNFTSLEHIADSLPDNPSYPLHEQNRRIEDRLDQETVIHALTLLFRSQGGSWQRRLEVLERRLAGESLEAIAKHLACTPSTISKDLMLIAKAGRKIVDGYVRLKAKVGREHAETLQLAMRQMTIAEIARKRSISPQQVLHSLQVIAKELQLMQGEEMIHSAPASIGRSEGGEPHG